MIEISAISFSGNIQRLITMRTVSKTKSRDEWDIGNIRHVPDFKGTMLSLIHTDLLRSPAFFEVCGENSSRMQ
jgi:hypothetical protein